MREIDKLTALLLDKHQLGLLKKSAKTNLGRSKKLFNNRGSFYLTFSQRIISPLNKGKSNQICF